MTAPYDPVADMTAEPLLEVRDLKVSFRTEDGIVRAVGGVSLSLAPGETLGIVGESGSGKSVTMMSVMRLITDPNARFEGEVRYKGQDLMKLDQDQIKAIRGAGIAMIFQDPMTSLNPVYRVGWQIEEQIRAHEQISKRAARARAIDLLAAVGIPHAAQRVDDYPHQFSGGMRQRVMIAMALSCNPDILIADEPTTALDVTIQAQILGLIKKLRDDFGTAVVLITHDMGVVADVADRIAVMYAGRIVEQGSRRDIFYDARHPYTWGLLGSIARLDRPKPRRLTAIPGVPPSLLQLPKGCAFGARCPHRFALCEERPDLLDKAGDGHLDACHLDLTQKEDLRETTIHPELIEEAK
jgi:peptide/nickel transport system ATP-binding protein/oligopeptide transport system ATP-binding protein